MQRHAPPHETVVNKIRLPVRPRNAHQLIMVVVNEGARTVGGEIAIGVVGVAKNQFPYGRRNCRSIRIAHSWTVASMTEVHPEGTE
jgi:hypothetical protein